MSINLGRILRTARVAFTAVLAACIAGCSTERSPDPRPAAATQPAAAGPLEKRDHDDPVVIDNPEIKVYRKNGMHGEPTKSGNRWELGPGAPFTRVEITSWKSAKEGYVLALDEGAADFEFSVVDGASLTKAFTLRRTPGADKRPVYVEEAATKFQGGEKHEKKKMKSTLPELHIGEIRVGGKAICVATGGAPVEAACTSSDRKVPFALTVEICANKECSVSPHPDR